MHGDQRRSLMQVAAYADHHVLVEKHMDGDRPVTTFRTLREHSERVGEVAAMMDLDAAVAGRLVAQAAQDIAQQQQQQRQAAHDAAADDAAQQQHPLPAADGDSGHLDTEGIVKAGDEGEGGHMHGGDTWDGLPCGSSGPALQSSEGGSLASEALRPA